MRTDDQKVIPCYGKYSSARITTNAQTGKVLCNHEFETGIPDEAKAPDIILW